MLRAIGGALAWAVSLVSIACPVDVEPRAPGVALTVQVAGAPLVSLDAADLAHLPATTLTQRQRLSSSASGASERSTAWSGVLLRDVLLRAGFGTGNDRGARTGVVVAVATDGYRAVFSWGELFNAESGEQVLVVLAQDGRPLDAVAGPLALRAPGDIRPGPRHVRNLCAVVVSR